MPGPNRPVSDREKALEPTTPEANFTLAWVRRSYESVGGREFSCTISGYRRTQIFEFPGINFHPNVAEPHHMIYSTPEIQACVASDLVGHFENGTSSNHYSISPSLRYMVGETEETIKSQQQGRVPVFLAIEESNELTPTHMVNGECSIADEIAIIDGEIVPALIGGREGEQFITAWAAMDGAWPELPNNQKLINMILAVVRAGQKTVGPIRKHLDQNGLVTDDGRFVIMNRPTVSARATTATPMDTTAFRSRVSELKDALAAMALDIHTPHLALLVNSMYKDEYKDDAYQRLEYLGLWESLTNAARPRLGYQGNIRKDQVIVAGNKTLAELNNYRDDIAHWWTDSLDENYLADLQKTINALIRSKYF